MAIRFPLSQQGYKHRGQYHAVVDDCDKEVAQLRWSVKLHVHTTYAFRTVKALDSDKRDFIFLHRMVMARMLGRDLKQDEHVEHVDGDGLNNRRDNLRLVTEETGHVRRYANNTSGYRFVTWHKKSGKWQSRMLKGGKQITIGYYDTPEEAHEAYLDFLKQQQD